MRTVVFVGPSFPPKRVREFLPHAEVRPPIRRNDLESIEAPTTVAIIDGVFDAELAVSPREIRSAIARGIRVLGASSMGALRATEVPEMTGVGRIYEMYRDRQLERDDEVAVMFDQDSGRALTVPLVNVRYSTEALVTSATLDRTTADTIVQTGSKLHFGDRTYQVILERAGLGERDDVDLLKSALSAIDLKREDAQTLLETLARNPPATQVREPGMAERPDERHDHFDDIRILEESSIHAPVQIWEFGERFPFRDLVLFMAVTGKFEPYARRAFLEMAIQTPPNENAKMVEGAPSVQQLFQRIMDASGWRTHEEVHGTLRDLGVGFRELQAGLRLDRRVHAHLRAVWNDSESAFWQVLRTILVRDQLTLKREAMRFSAVLGLASRDTGGQVSAAERVEAQRAALSERPELTWAGLLAEACIADGDAQSCVEQIARARRVGMPLLGRMEAAHGLPGADSRGCEGLPLTSHGAGVAGRSMPDADAETIVRNLASKIGVTRIAQLGELERFGVHVAAAFRASTWSSTLGSGKAETPEGAAVGSVMEELEKYCQERFVARDSVLSTFAQFEGSNGPRAIDPRTLPLPFDSSYDPEGEISWTSVDDLATGARCLLPSALFVTDREKHDVLFSSRRGRKILTTNGLASGFTLTEALVHAACELIERHAAKLAEQAIGNPGPARGGPWPDFRFIDLATCPPAIREIVSRVRSAGFEVRALDITSEVTVPTIAVRLFRTLEPHGVDGIYAPGACTHPNPEIAINRAILEAVQNQVCVVAGAREDLSLRARSLGRHERPRPLTHGDAYWIRPHVPRKPFQSLAGFVGKSAREDLAYIVRRITAAGFEHVLWRGLAGEDVAPAAVVRVVVPGMEDINPFYTGLRARVRLVEDLLRRE